MYNKKKTAKSAEIVVFKPDLTQEKKPVYNSFILPREKCLDLALGEINVNPRVILSHLSGNFFFYQHHLFAISSRMELNENKIIYNIHLYIYMYIKIYI